MTHCFCGSQSSTTIRTKIRGDKKRRIVQCDRCNAVRKGDIDAAKHTELHQKNKQVEEIDLESLSDSYRERNLLDINRRIDKIKPFLSGDENVLDLGTGMGHFLDKIDPYVNKVVGTEINQKRIILIRDELGYPVYEGTQPIVEEFDEDYFDIVTMFHSLEHFVDPIKQLKSIRPVIKGEGDLFIEVPNHDDILLEISDAYADFYYQDAHSYYFDPSSLKLALIMSDYQSNITGIQRYSLQNSLHWIIHAEPELDDPSRYRDTWRKPINKLYSMTLSKWKRSDTLWAVCQPDW